MTEEFDALHGIARQQVVWTALVLLALGIGIEVGLRLLKRWALSRNWERATVALTALLWHPLFWCVLVSVGPSWVNLANSPAAKQQRNDLLVSIFLISLTIIVVRIAAGWLALAAAKRMPASVSVLKYLLNGMAITIILLISLYLLDAPVSIMLFTLAGSSVGLSLAFNEPLTNLFSGAQLTASRRMKPGDYVRLPSGNEGYVEDIEWDMTTVRQIEDNLIIVPNSILIKAEIVNYQLPDPEQFVLAEVGVSYDSDLETVERVTNEVATGVMQDVGGGVPTAPPFIRYHKFADFSINFTVFLRGREYYDQLLIRHEFIKRLHTRFRQEGIVIPYPIRTLHTRDDSPIGVDDHRSGRQGRPEPQART